MMRPSRPRLGRSARAGIAVALAFAATLLLPAQAWADEDQYGEGEVVITVVIDEFDPCAVGAPGCGSPGGGDGLAATGSVLGFGAAGAVLATAAGAFAYAVARRRSLRRSS